MDFEDPYGLEDWEADKIFFEKEDWPNLLKLREERSKRRIHLIYMPNKNLQKH
ncbi:MAG: hypothetical protein U5Q03_04805 [Bacteroidota bacterium]|nr:hypothetical protein [Bacteroidota bacterium]